MEQCYKLGDFKKYFNENMNELGLTVPSGLFNTSEKATETATLILSAVKQLGKSATMAEIVGATVGLEKLLVLGGMSASGYVGAVIGSIAVATGRSFGCGSRISDMFTFLERKNLKFNNWNIFYAIHSEILDNNFHYRKRFGIKCNYLPSSLTFDLEYA